MTDDLKLLIEEYKLNIYDIAIMTRDGIWQEYYQKCNACNNCYSITKILVNTLIGILADKKLLDIQWKVMDILQPQIHSTYDRRWDEVTVHHAMKHTMGIDRGLFDVDVDDTNTFGTEDYLQYALSYPPVYRPGTTRVYSDVAHYLLSRLISQLTGRPADEMFQSKVANPLNFRPMAWFRCPENYIIGATGAYTRTSDLVKLGWLYLNYGIYNGERIISEEWVRKVEQEEYDLYPIGKDDFLAKQGMNGQMLMFSRKRGMAVAWLGCNKDGEDQALIDYFDSI